MYPLQVPCALKPTRFSRGSGPCEEKNSAADKDGGEPAAAVDVFMQEEFSGQGVSDKGERGGGRSHHTEVRPRESGEVAKEGDGHEGDSTEEHAAREQAGQHGAEAVAAAKVIQVADTAHGQGNQDISGGGGADGGEDAEPGIEGSHQRSALSAPQWPCSWRRAWADVRCEMGLWRPRQLR